MVDIDNLEILKSIIDRFRLGEKEYEVFAKVMEELSNTGDSPTLRSLENADYEESPVDIETFLCDDHFIGKNTGGGEYIFPYWRDRLIEIFSPDSPFYEVCITGSIGTGKTTFAVVGLAYMIYKLMCLRDPQSYYGLMKGWNIGVAFFNVTREQSYGVAFSRLQKLLISSPWFLEHGHVRGREDQLYVPNKSIEYVVGSKEAHGIGRDIFCLDGDTEILTVDGPIKISDLEGKSTRVMSFGYKGEVVVSEECTAVRTASDAEIYEFELENGSVIRCTSDHRFLVVDQNGKYVYKAAGDLDYSDEIIDVA